MVGVTRVGAYWGLGHLMTIFVVGSGLIVLRVGMTSRVQWALDLMVVLVLMWLGVRTIRKRFTGRTYTSTRTVSLAALAYRAFLPQSWPF
jgi:hypothetical protein